MKFTNRPVLRLDGSIPPEYYDEDYWERGAASSKGSYNGNEYSDNPQACMAWAQDMLNRWGPFESVLELGAGRGWNIYGFLHLDAGVYAVGVDHSHYAVSTANPRVKPFLVEHDACDLSAVASDGSFDLVFSNDFLEHLTVAQAARCLAECKRVARVRVVHLISIADGLDLPEGPAPPDQDQSHVNLKSAGWWFKFFTEVFSGPPAWTVEMKPHGRTIEMDVRRLS